MGVRVAELQAGESAAADARSRPRWYGVWYAQMQREGWRRADVLQSNATEVTSFCARSASTYAR